MHRSSRLLPALLLALPAAGTAQISIGPGGVRSGNTVIDSTGVHTRGADVTASGVRERSGSGSVILTNGQRRSIDCRGDRLTVNGNRNRLSVAHCKDVTVAGNGNTIAARFDAPGRISVPGNRNSVSWSARAGVRVGVTSPGTANSVVRR